MITCDYEFEGEKISKEQLYKKLLEAVGQDTTIEEVLYSRADIQTSRTKVLENLKHNGIIDTKNSPLLDGDISLKGSRGGYSISSFLDSPLAVINGNPLYPLKVLDDYKLEKYNILISLGKSSDEANKIINDTISNWDKIIEDSKVLHLLCVDYTIGHHERDWDVQRSKFILKALTIVKQNSPLRDETLLKSLYNLFATFYRNTKGIWPESTCIRNIGLTAKLKDINEELFGHIDYAFIDKFGNLHLYNFKISSQNPSTWVYAKKLKYKLEGSFLKQMLIANGISVKNIGEITYDIVPLVLDYNEDFTRINKAKLLFSISLDFSSNERYIAREEDNAARNFVKIPFDINIDEVELNEVDDKFFLYAFPFMKVSKDRIYNSTLDWIKTAPSVGDTESLIIKEVNEIDCRYRVILYGKTYDIKDFTKKENNREIISLVSKHLNKLNSELGNYSSKISTAVERAFKHKSPYLDELNNNSFVSGVLSKYLPVSKDSELIWDLNTDLIEYNILLFRNVNTKLIDVVTITSEDLELLGDFKKGATNILGSYKLDGNKDASTLRGDMGNIELMRGMLLLNQLLPSLDSPKLGEIIVLSSARNGQSRRHYILEYNENYFKHFIKIIKKENGEDLKDLKNNFKSSFYIDILDDVISTYTKLTEDLSEAQKNVFELMGFDNLDELEKTGKVLGLFNLLTLLSNYLKGYSPEEIYNLAHPRSGIYVDPLKRTAALLYELVSKAYNLCTNQVVLYQPSLSYIDIHAYTAPTIPDQNVRLVVNNLQTTLDSIAFEENKLYELEISPIVLEYYKACGYTNIQNMVIGNLLHLFDNLYQENSENLIFKNPYDNSNNLKPHERLFLKKVLFFINKVKLSRFSGSKSKFSSYNDPKIALYINNDKEGEKYLWVPLTRASKASQRQLNLESRIQRLRRAFRIAQKSEDWYTEAISKMSKEEREEMDKSIQSLQLKNPFDIGERSIKSRQNYINNNSKGFFETNVENIMVEYMAKAIETEKLNKFLVGTKSLLLLLHIMGNDSNESKNIIEKESKLIKEYITQNVFNTSTMDPTNLKIVGALSGLKSKVTFLNLAGNLVSFFRDIINGFGENFLRSATKFLTNIKSKYLREAYQYVFVHGRSDAMNINLLSKLNIRYRLSNTDLARIKERLHTGRNGLYNWDNWAYATLRSPDFLNRMTLFVAKCMQDGVWDAYSYENGELKYDVKKDKRFYHFIHNQKDHPDYIKEKALFILHVNNWNKEHPDKLIDWADKVLPEPYSDQEILAIKNLSNNIYGSYDKSLKSQYEHTALGWAFGMYTTWMNGMWNNLAMKPGKYNVYQMLTEIDEDEEGNHLYMEDNGLIVTQKIDESGNKIYVRDNGEIISSENLTPVLKQVPVIAQGMWYTLKDMFSIFLESRKDGKSGLKAVYNYILGNEIDKKNIRQLLGSLLIALLFLVLFKTALEPIYKESKKKDNGLRIGGRLMASVTYKSLNGARDSFAGPLNIIEYFGEQLDPPMYKVPVKLVKDSGNFLFGDKTFKQLITGNVAVARAYKDIV